MWLPFWKRRRPVISLAELYAQRWRDYEERHPDARTGDPGAPTCRQCGAGKTRHRATRDEGDPVLWCARCDQPATAP